MQDTLAGKRAVVVGASSGMGRAIADLLSQNGAEVYLLSRTQRKLESVAEQLPGPAHVVTMDMLDESSVETAFEQIGSFDYLTITAVSDETKLMRPVVELDYATAQRGMEKFWGTFLCCRAAAKRVSANGAIVVTSSVGIYKPSASGASVMNAASAAVNVFAKALARELAPVRINVVAPGVVKTGVWSDEEIGRYEAWGRVKLPVGQLGTPAALAQAYLQLLTNPYITGSTLAVDGGLSLL